jgi:hypothetical protein
MMKEDYCDFTFDDATVMNFIAIGIPCLVSLGKRERIPKERGMNTPQQQASPCPECGNQRYIARNQRIEVGCHLQGYNFSCTIVICGTCGYTALYASDPRNTIATIEKRLAEARKMGLLD